MSEEEKKAIENFKSFVKEKDREQEILYQKALSELEIADKMIDKMAEYIGSNNITETFCEEKVECDEQCKNCIKEYFRKKIK